MAIVDFKSFLPIHELRDAYSHAPNLTLEIASKSDFNQLRGVYPNLVSLMDEDGKIQESTEVCALKILCQGKLSSVANMILNVNSMKKCHRNLYARIDLVMTDKLHQGLGIARVLVLSMCYLTLLARKGRIYSMSCLAAHVAMERLLEAQGFKANQRAGENFVHEELELDDNEMDIRSQWLDALVQALKQTQYKIRQKQG